MKGLKLRSVIGLFCLVLILAGVLVAHVWKQNAYVRLSMDRVKLAKQQAQLRNEIALLDVSVGSLKKISRIEALAKGRFGLEYVKAPVLVYLDEDAPRSAGGSRPYGDARSLGSGGRGREAGSEAAGPQAAAQGEKDLQSGKVAWRTSGL